MTPEKKSEYKSRINSTLAIMYNKTMHEDIRRIMDSIDDDALSSLVNLVGKIYKLCDNERRLRKDNCELTEKIKRMRK